MEVESWVLSWSILVLKDMSCCWDSAPFHVVTLQRVPEYATLKCATMAHGLFWAEGNQDPGDSGKTVTSSLTVWKNLDGGVWPPKGANTRENFYQKDLKAGWANIGSSYLPVTYPPPLWSPRPLALPLAQGGTEASDCLTAFGSHIFIGCHMYKNKFFSYNLS